MSPPSLNAKAGCRRGRSSRETRGSSRNLRSLLRRKVSVSKDQSAMRAPASAEATAGKPGASSARGRACSSASVSTASMTPHDSISARPHSPRSRVPRLSTNACSRTGRRRACATTRRIRSTISVAPRSAAHVRRQWGARRGDLSFAQQPWLVCFHHEPLRLSENVRGNGLTGDPLLRSQRL